MLPALLLLLVLVLAVVLAIGGHGDAGYALLGIGHWTVETSLLALVTLLVGGLLLVVAAWRLLVGLVILPRRLRTRVGQQREMRANAAFAKGMLLFLRQQWRAAELELVRHASDHPLAWLSHLAAARAAQMLSADDRREHYLRRATDAAPPEARIAALALEGELALQRRDQTQVEAVAARIEALPHGETPACALRLQLFEQTADWDRLLATLALPAAATALDSVQRERLRRRALRGRLEQAAAEGRLDRLHAAWQDATPADQAARELRLSYAAGLVRLGADAEAARVIVDAVDESYDAELVQRYAQLDLSDPLGQLATLERWIGRDESQPELFMAAGRACLRQRLWGKARAYFETALRLAPSPAGYAELVPLLEQMGDREAADRMCREGLRLAVAGSAVAPAE
jgi:Uncharacterized enzyme of heme biosynthesis